MKRILRILSAAMLAACLLLPAHVGRIASAEVCEEYYTGDMIVVNCKESAALRSGPDASFDRIAKVPLGEQVTDCAAVSEEFICCRYDGYIGYIPTEYLTDPVYTGSGEDEAQGFGGSVLETALNGYAVMALRGCRDDGETLKTTCYDAADCEVWSYETATVSRTELDMTGAFIGGTEEVPLVMIYNAEVGLVALDLVTGEEQWRLPAADIDLGGSISAATGSDGTMYIGGYYGPDPVAIDLHGRVIWQAQPSAEAYWLYEIVLNDNGVTAVYDSLSGQAGWICYDYATGAELENGWD